MEATNPGAKVPSKDPIPAETKRRLDRCIELLEEAYGLPRRRGDAPVDLLVQTILSQNTTSANTHRAFESLKRAYPAYQALLSAPDEEVAGLIRCGGLANIKTRRIKEALAMIQERQRERKRARGGERGGPRGGDGGGKEDEMGEREEAGGPERIDLEFLRGADPEEAREFLVSLPGVGPKTAAVVLLFAFRMPLLPVDTHVNRLSRRLGFVPAGASIEEAERILEEITPREKYCSFHVNLIRHGRAVCRARSPSCGACILAEVCPSAGRVGQKG